MQSTLKQNPPEFGNNLASKLANPLSSRVCKASELQTTQAASSLAFSLLPEGFSPSLPRGALTEISGFAGSGKTEAVIRLIAENPELRVAWIEEQFTIYPCAFPLAGVDLERILFVDTAADGVSWAAHQLLRSQIFGILVISSTGRRFQQIELRRLQIAAERAQVAVVLLHETPIQNGSWPIALQLEASRGFERREPCLRVIKSQKRGRA